MSIDEPAFKRHHMHERPHFSGSFDDSPNTNVPQHDSNPADAPLGCPPPETIVNFALREGSASVRNRVNAHLRICSRCRIEVEALSQALVAPLDDTSETDPEALCDRDAPNIVSM